MKCMMIVKATKESESGAMPSESTLAAMASFNEEMFKAGIVKDLGGVKPSSAGFRLQINKGKRMLIDGPFAETKELLAGYWVIEVGSIEEARGWLMKVPAPHEGESIVELRPLFEIEDFTSGEAIDRHKELGAQYLK